MEAKHTSGPLSRQERRELDRLQIRWHLQTISEEEKQRAMSLGMRDQRCKSAPLTEVGFVTDCASQAKGGFTVVVHSDQFIDAGTKMYAAIAKVTGA